MSVEAIAIARAAFAEAIATCTGAWKERWDRAPTTNELVHAFEVCLSANPDAYVADVGPVLAIVEAPAKPPPAIDFDAFEVVFRDEGKLGIAEAELYAPGVEKKPGWGEVQVYLEVKADTLVVDVAYETHREVPSFALACALVRARVLHRWIGRRDGPIARVVLRPLSALDATITLAWPPPEEP